MIKKIRATDARKEYNLIFLKSFIIIIIKIAAKVLKKNEALSPLKNIKTSIKINIKDINSIIPFFSLKRKKVIPKNTGKSLLK